MTIASLVVLALGGWGLRAATNNFVVGAIGYFIIGVAGVIAMAAAFVAVGNAEDRQRERDEQGRPPADST